MREFEGLMSFTERNRKKKGEEKRDDGDGLKEKIFRRLSRKVENERDRV